MHHIAFGPDKFKSEGAKETLAFLQIDLEKRVQAVLSARRVIVVIIVAHSPISFNMACFLLKRQGRVL